MAIKMHIALAIATVATGGIAIAAGADQFLASKLDEYFAEAKPVGRGLWVTDKDGCLYSINHGETGLRAVPMLDTAKRPVCRK